MPLIVNKNHFVIDVPNLGGGRNTKDSNTLINDIEAVDIENFDFEERGAIKKVNGSYKLNTTAIADAPVNSLYEAIKSDGTSHLLAFCGTGIYRSTDGGAGGTIGGTYGVGQAGGAGGAGSSRATQVALPNLFGSTGFFNFF